MTIKKVVFGLPLTELMIGVSIVGILASMAIPAYSTLVKKARFSEVVLHVGALKREVELCLAINDNDLASCSTPGTNGIPANQTNLTATVASIEVSDEARITGTGTAKVGAASYYLSPTINNGVTKWTKGGTCIAQNIC